MATAPTRLLLKLRPGTALRMGAAADRARLRPLFETPPATPGLGMAAAPALAEPAWHVAELDAAGPTPWDSAHAQIADRLGVAGDDLLAVEPDFEFVRKGTHPSEERATGASGAFGAQPDCTPAEQTSKGGRIKGPDTFAWHLGDDFSGLATARDSVEFTEVRTRIAHLDTGYDKNHQAKSPRVLTDLERNFVDADGRPNDASDPNRRHLFDQSGHGTGTLGILAAGALAAHGDVVLGGAPGADILPLRVSNSVIHLWTSAFASALRWATDCGCDVVSASLGGLPSRVWNETVDYAYERGVVLVAASGDHWQGLPTHHVVYPARYHRAIAACGVMANFRPYTNLTSGIEGSWGPKSSMRQAMSAFTPNIPWAKIGCTTTLDLDGEGTSASTPQIAAAAALWIEQHKLVLSRTWRRVEAVRKALFEAARAPEPGTAEKIGHGTLRAATALAAAPNLNLEKTPRDHDWLAFLRVMTGLGVTGADGEGSPRQAMFELELAQRWMANPDAAAAMDDPDVEPSDDALRAFVEAVIADGGASLALRRQLAERWRLVSKATIAVPRDVEPPTPPAFRPKPRRTQATPLYTDPPVRRLHTYALDPSFSTRLETASTNEATLAVRWEKLKKGPVGEYLAVDDTDATGVRHEGVDLDHPALLAQDGLAPAEGVPGFHQQSVYAVAMTTIEQFESALGRPVFWRPRPNPANANDDSRWVRRLAVRPHALYQANAFYSPNEVALLFGYFEADASDPSDHLPGSTVYTCLSHDVVAHETTHAILDGMHRRYEEPSNPDVLAFHEGFADLVALMQHFALPEIVERELARTRGALDAESTLGSLAVEFGRAVGRRGALREGIGSLDADGVWRRLEPDPAAYERTLEPHARGAILVAAVLDAFLAIYQTRSTELIRLATGGSGVLPAGALHPTLLKSLADEAAKSARHVARLAIRALDYLPPVDVTFGELLRALITADYDMVPEDRYGYRVAFLESFRRRGLVPRDLPTLSVDTLRWNGAEIPPKSARRLSKIVLWLRELAAELAYISDRRRLFYRTRGARKKLHGMLKRALAANEELSEALGLDPALPVEVHELRRAARSRPSGGEVSQMIVALAQERELAIDGVPRPHLFRGGATLIVDLAAPSIQYAIVKHVTSDERERKMREFLTYAYADPVLRLLVERPAGEAFGVLHGVGKV